MAEVFFDNPPVLSGNSEDRLRQLQSYLSTMSGKLQAQKSEIGRAHV